MRHLLAISATLVLCLGAVACGSDDDEPEGAGDTAAETTTATEPAPSAGCKEVEAPDPKEEGTLRRPKARLARSQTHTATIVTNCGEIQIRLDVKGAPKTASSFAYLARRGFYDSVVFHRIAQAQTGGDFVIQGGDPTGTGQGGPGYSVVEAPPETTTYTRGVVAMAKTAAEEPGTSGSQFFIVTAQDATLPPEYAILGRVVKGDDVVSRIAAVETNPETEQPLSPVVIERVKISSR